MKKIVEYRKLLNVEKTAELKDLKTIYRNAMKESHPDKFVGDDAGLKDAEEKSKTIIEAYHFLVSIHPETIKLIYLNTQKQFQLVQLQIINL